MLIASYRDVAFNALQVVESHSEVCANQATSLPLRHEGTDTLGAGIYSRWMEFGCNPMDFSKQLDHVEKELAQVERIMGEDELWLEESAYVGRRRNTPGSWREIHKLL